VVGAGRQRRGVVTQEEERWSSSRTRLSRRGTAAAEAEGDGDDVEERRTKVKVKVKVQKQQQKQQKQRQSWWGRTGTRPPCIEGESSSPLVLVSADGLLVQA
jgi:hypothetical protein